MPAPPPRPTARSSDAMRSCVKTGCRWPAAATLSYRYATGEVWLSDLGEDHPSTHDLCPHHADSLTVPRGWTLVDDRDPAEAVHEPSAAELVQRVAQLRDNVAAALERPAPTDGVRRSRYADLLQHLPTRPPDDGTAADDPSASAAGDAAAVDDDPIPASSAADPAAAHRAVPAPHPHDPDGRQAVHETGLRGAVVVQLPLRTDDTPAGE